MKKTVFILILGLMTFHSQAQINSGIPSVVPKPVEMKAGKGSFNIHPDIPLMIKGEETETRRIAEYFIGYLRFPYGKKLNVNISATKDKKAQAVIFEIDPHRYQIPQEGYELKVTTAGIRLTASGGAGLFRGVQTLLQLLPPEIFAPSHTLTSDHIQVPALFIRDYPRFHHRGMHLDVSRHFFPKEFIKKYIDLIAMYRMNTFHWHLTDDNGWRIEIKKYPELTRTSAWRADREHLPWDKRPPQEPGEAATYGGFYTQDDIREIVKYADERYIKVIPEIEMPAHCVEVLAAYPSLSCTGGPFTVPTGSYWPNIDIFCAGNDSVFTFLEDVLTEVMELFPSAYIHIGGDEADRTNWKQCPKCQQRMKAEGLKDEKELQSYFIRRIERFIISKNRKMIGWDEILEGGLAPEATVMSWRGVEGGIAAARMGHDVIMTPTKYCYLDYYQADPESEPLAIGGLVTLRTVYSFDPVPEELTPKEAKHILGAQGNLWTEYISTPEQAEYMALPRMIALAEVNWSPKNSRNWDDFLFRLQDQFTRLDHMKVNYSRGSYRVDVKTVKVPKENTVMLHLGSEQFNPSIHYTLDGSDVTAASPVYTGPIPLSRNGIVRAGIFVDGVLKGKLTEMPLAFHLAIGSPVTYLALYSYRYPAAVENTLTDGLKGSSNFRDGYWQGFHGVDLEVIVDLGREIPVNSVQMNFLQSQKSWIFLPAEVEYSLSSDRKKFHSVNEVMHKVSQKEERSVIHPFNFQFREKTMARYVKVKAKSLGVCPSWHEGAGEKCWIFADEIVVF